jgi:hypothetical protein
MNVLKQYAVLLVVCITFTSSCRQTDYEGTVFNYEARKPVVNARVSFNSKHVYTDKSGHFTISKGLTNSRAVVFSKAGYCSDTIETLTIRSGEFTIHRFEDNDTVYLFSKTSKFRDLVKNLNGTTDLDVN